MFIDTVYVHGYGDWKLCAGVWSDDWGISFPTSILTTPCSFSIGPAGTIVPARKLLLTFRLGYVSLFRASPQALSGFFFSPNTVGTPAWKWWKSKQGHSQDSSSVWFLNKQWVEKTLPLVQTMAESQVLQSLSYWGQQASSRSRRASRGWGPAWSPPANSVTFLGRPFSPEVKPPNQSSAGPRGTDTTGGPFFMSRLTMLFEHLKKLLRAALMLRVLTLTPNKTKQRTWRNLWRWWICLPPWPWWRFHGRVHMSKLVGSYPLNMCVFGGILIISQ